MRPLFCQFASVTVALGLIPTATLAETIHKWVDVEGVVHYSDYPPPADVAVAIVFDIGETNSPDWDAASYLSGFLAEAQRNRERRAEEREQREKERREAAASRQPAPVLYDSGYEAYDYYPTTYALFVNRHYNAKTWRFHRPGHHHRPHGHHPAKHPVPTLTPSARSFRFPGAHRRFGHLGHRFTHRNQ